MKAFVLLIFLASLTMSWGQCGSFNLTVTKMDPLCYGFCDGSVTGTVTGENGMVNGQITDSVGTIVLAGTMGTTPNSLCPGWYWVEVVDDSGCYAMDSIYLINPDELQAVISFTDPTDLDSCNGIAEVDTVLFYQGSYANIGYYWSPGGPSGIGETIKDNLCNDFYSLTINDAYGCSVVIDFASGSANTDENSLTEPITIFPNPFSDKIHISENIVNGTRIEIYNMIGQRVYSEMVTNNELDLSWLKTGQYVIKFELEDKTYLKKLTKR